MRRRHQWLALHAVARSRRRMGQRRRIAALPCPHHQLPRENSRPRAYLNLNLMAYVVDVPLQEVPDLLDRGAERETVPKLGDVNRRPGPCMLIAHGQPPFCLRLTGSESTSAALLASPCWSPETPFEICYFRPNSCSFMPLRALRTLSLIAGMECDKPAPPDT